MLRKLIEWWRNRPPGYSELRVPANATPGEVACATLRIVKQRGLQMTKEELRLLNRRMLQSHREWNGLCWVTPREHACIKRRCGH